MYEANAAASSQEDYVKRRGKRMPRSWVGYGWRQLLPLLGVLACSKEPARLASAMSQPDAAPPSVVTVADTGATLNPPAELDMEQQHHSMLMIGRGYDALFRALADGDKAGATKHVKEMLPYVDRVPRFMIHVPDVTPDSMIIWARKLKGQLLRVDQLVAADSVKQANELATRIVLTCGECHAKYQAPHPGN